MSFPVLHHHLPDIIFLTDRDYTSSWLWSLRPFCSFPCSRDSDYRNFNGLEWKRWGVPTVLGPSEGIHGGPSVLTLAYELGRNFSLLSNLDLIPSSFRESNGTCTNISKLISGFSFPLPTLSNAESLELVQSTYNPPLRTNFCPPCLLHGLEARE